MFQCTLFKVCRRESSMNSSSIFGFLKFSIDKKKNNDFVKVKVHLIHRKRVPLLHNTVLILYYEGDGCVHCHTYANTQT